jgi:hypothetical protein
MRLRREHSQKFLEDGLKPWLNEIHVLCRFGAEYTKNDKKFVPYIPDDPNQILFVGLKAHLITGYPEVLQEWTNYKKIVQENNQKWADLFNDLILKIETATNIPKFHFYVQETKPPYFIAPVNIVAYICNKIRYELVSGQPFVDRINYTPTSEGNLRYFSVAASVGELGRVNVSEDFSSVLKTMEEHQSDKAVRAKMGELLRVENEDLSKIKTIFEDKLKELNWTNCALNCLPWLHWQLSRKAWITLLIVSLMNK